MKRGKERNEGTMEPAFAGRQVNNRTAFQKNKPVSDNQKGCLWDERTGLFCVLLLCILEMNLAEGPPHAFCEY